MVAQPKGKIIERYNNAVTAIEAAYQLASEGFLNNSLNKIDQSAIEVYESMEWFIKHYLFNIFTDKAKFHKEIEIADGNNFYKKIKLFEKYALPSVSTNDINLSIITELKQSVRNDPEHSGIIPHFNSLLKVIIEIGKIISIYFDASKELKKLPEPYTLILKENNNWPYFFNIVDNFAKERNYVLIAGEFPVGNILQPLGLIDWNIIIDFDPNSVNDGLHKSISSVIKTRRTIHQFTLRDNFSGISNNNTTQWIFANGLTGRNNTTFKEFKDWNRNYYSFFDKIITKLQSEYANNPTTVIIAKDDYPSVYELVKLFYNHFGDSVKFVFAIENSTKFKSLIDHYDCSEINIPIGQITDGILRIKNYINPVFNDNTIQIPHKDYTFVEITKEDFIWIEEDLELIHKNIIDEELKVYKKDERIHFYKGGSITWKGLHLNFDITRDFTPIIENKIEKKLKERTIQKFIFFHYPGIGGTTISKRVAWNLHNKYPVLLLKKSRQGSTVDRIYKIFQLSLLPPLVIFDSSIFNEEAFKQIYKEVQSRNFPCVFLMVERRSTTPKNISIDDHIYLSETLSDIETNTFVNNYSDLAIDKAIVLNRILVSSENKERHPFFLGLIAFEHNFIGLKDFVQKAIQMGSDQQRKILSIISFCGIYAQKSISAQLFTGILNIQESSLVKLERYLPSEILYLIINEDGLNWRPLHYLISKEILTQLLGEGDEYLMRSNLSDFSINLIELIKNRSYYPTDEEFEVLDRLFIERSGDEIYDSEEESHFSKLITHGILEDSSRLRIFEKLTESFPEESYFWSHLARFYNFRIKDFDKALFAINAAIELEGEDSSDYTLFHIRGMIYRSKARRLMSKHNGEKNLAKDKIQEIQELIEKCGDQFLKTREINPRDQHGYVTHIEAIAAYIDFKYSISSFTDRASFMAHMNSYDLELLNTAEDLLDEIKSIFQNQTDNYYINRCESKILEFYSNYNVIIQAWNSLLDKNVISNKNIVRRQLVYAYVGRAKGWDTLNIKDIDRIITLLEENIQENPSNDENIKLWFRTARQSTSIDIMGAIDRLSQWKVINNSIEATFYLLILHTIQAIENNSISKIRAEELIRETSERSRTFNNRSYCSEWLGEGVKLKKILKSHIAYKRDGSFNFLFNNELLKKIKGKVVEIRGPEAGRIELDCGLTAFFIPARANNGQGILKDRDLNEDVDFFLGFSYDGLRAYEVNKLTR